METTKNYDAKIIISKNQVTFFGFHISKNYMKIYLEHNRLCVCGSSHKYDIPNSVFISLKNATPGMPYIIMSMNSLNEFFANIPIKELHFNELPIIQCYESIETIDFNDLPDKMADNALKNEAMDIVIRYKEATSPEFLRDCNIDIEDKLKFVYVPGGATGETLTLMDVPNNLYIALLAPYFGADKYLTSVTGTRGIAGIPITIFWDSILHLKKLLPYLQKLSDPVYTFYVQLIMKTTLAVTGKNPGIVYIGK